MTDRMYDNAVFFQVEDEYADQVRAWADRLDIDLSELLRTAVRKHLRDLAAENDVAAWAVRPLDEAERSLEELADWGPAEDWSDWA